MSFEDQARRDAIEGVRQLIGLPKSTLAKLSGLSPGEYTCVLTGDRPVSSMKLAALEKTLADVYALLGFIDSLVADGAIVNGTDFAIVLPLDMTNVDNLRRLVGQMRVSQKV